MLAFQRPLITDKISHLEADLNLLLKLTTRQLEIPVIPARDIEIRPTKDHPSKLGFSKVEGQARALHDLASIELQAMELGLRTLAEFPDAPPDFRKQLADITFSEGQHLQLCLRAMVDLGFNWGDWPIHTTLWNAVHDTDSLLERIFIVHRYLEGSGLDAGAQLSQRLAGVPGAERAQQTVSQINKEEIDHVRFGSFWFKEICARQKLVPEHHFREVILKLQVNLPKRIERLNHPLRLKSDFSPTEIAELEELRSRFLAGELAG